MRLPILATLALLGPMAAETLGCSYIPDERPWEERLADEPVIFVGSVIALLDEDAMAAMDRGACEPEGAQPPIVGDPSTCAILKVEQRLRGAKGRTYEVPQGQGADCGIVYEVGQRWIYAGNFIGGPSERILGPLSRQELNRLKQAIAR